MFNNYIYYKYIIELNILNLVIKNVINLFLKSNIYLYKENIIIKRIIIIKKKKNK